MKTSWFSNNCCLDDRPCVFYAMAFFLYRLTLCVVKAWIVEEI
jgi:hypothetical protein